MLCARGHNALLAPAGGGGGGLSASGPGGGGGGVLSACGPGGGGVYLAEKREGEEPYII